jgi:hypothetical protein
VTDYTAVGFEAEDIFTDWATYPIRLTAETQRVDLAAYDVAGKDHVDVFVFNDNGEEIDSTVSGFFDHSVPAGALYAPTTADDPSQVSILDDNDSADIVLPATVWVAVSNSGPDAPPEWGTYHLDVDVVGGSAGTGTTPAERIHSGQHAWWSGSVTGANSHLTETVDLTGVAAGARPTLEFWTWYQLEEGFDWAYALVSTDGGSTWTSLATSAAGGAGTTTLDPLGAAGEGAKEYDNGFTGTSGLPAMTSANLFVPTYTKQTADLSAYAGRTILVRFAQTSDGGVNLENFYVDDIGFVDGSGTPLSVGVANPDDAETTGAWTPGGSPGFTWVTADTAG